MNAIAHEFDKFQSSVNFHKCLNEVDELLELVEHTQQLIENDSTHANTYLKDLERHFRLIEKRITDDEKEIYSSLVKFGKVMDRTFKSSTSTNTKEAPISPGLELDKAVLMHLARSGEFDVATKLIEESHVTVPDHLLSEFAHMYGILQYITSKNLNPAIQWAAGKRQELLSRGSNLEFCLHKLQFIRYLVDEKSPKLALQYAQAHLSVFGDRYLDDISQLMSAILYVDKLESSPYSRIFSTPSFDQLYSMFASEFCSFLGLPPDSPLLLAVTAGTIALPAIAKIENIMKAQGAAWTTKQELPVEIELPENLRFHSIFVCPVSKEQTTEENPPMMLPCGHVVANNSLRSLCKDSPNHTFKCPYCPMDSTQTQAKRVYF